MYLLEFCAARDSKAEVLKKQGSELFPAHLNPELLEMATSPSTRHLHSHRLPPMPRPPHSTPNTYPSSSEFKVLLVNRKSRTPKHLKEHGCRINVVYTVGCSALESMQILVHPGTWRRFEYCAKWNKRLRTHSVMPRNLEESEPQRMWGRPGRGLSA